MLVCAEPVEGGVELVFIDGSELEGLAEGGECGFGVEGACGGEFGGGVEDAVRDHGGDEVAVSGGFSFEEGVEAEFVEGSQDGGDVSVGEGADDVDCLADGGIGEGCAFEDASERFDGGGVSSVEFGEVREGAFEDLPAVADGLSEEDGGGGVAVGDELYIHGHDDKPYRTCKSTADII